MAEPFFSIIIPIYNTVPEQIEFCMNSLTNQTMGDIEIILVDDGSNIDCANQCDAFAAKDPRVRVIHQPNQGVAIARNNGIKSATAEWILFVDADDWLELDAFEVLRNELTGSNLNILLSKHVRENDDNTQTFPEYQIQPNLTYDLTDPKTRELWYNAVIAPLFGKVAPLYYSWDKVFRRSFLLDNSLFFPEGIAKSEDKIFFLQCLEHLTSIRQIDRTFYHYRIQESSACRRFSSNIDANRAKLANTMLPLVSRLNQQLADAFHDDTYCLLTKNLNRYLYGIITEVLYLKFYHDDNPCKRTRRKDAIAFLNSEPFRCAIRNIPYRSLSRSAKLKKCLLQYGFVECFILLHTKFVRHNGL